MEDSMKITYTFAALGAALMLTVSACGDTTGQRAVSGAGIGAGVGAVGGALTGGSIAGGALLGGAVGAGTGALTNKHQIDLDR
jgi:osmotically inducible lipoprotein OsmB